MVWSANKNTIKFHRACKDLDLETLHNLLRFDKEKIDVKQLDEMKTLLETVGPIKMFSSMEQLQENMENDPQVKIVKMLCETDVDLHQKDLNGSTALHMACRGTKGTSSGSVLKFHANPRIVDILLEHGASVHAKDMHGHTPLHKACGSGNSDVVKTLIQHHADVHAKDHYGNTPLHKACERGNLEVVQTLIHHHADLHAMDESWETPLHKACWEGHLEIVKELLKYKPNINAICKGDERIKMTPLMSAAINGYFEIVEELTKHGAEINFSDPRYGSAMHLAITIEHELIVRTLLKNGCNINFRAKLTCEDDYLPDCTAFELALGMKSIDIVKMIAYHET